MHNVFIIKTQLIKKGTIFDRFRKSKLLIITTDFFLIKILIQNISLRDNTSYLLCAALSTMMKVIEMKEAYN